MLKQRFILTIAAILALHSIGRAAILLPTFALTPKVETVGIDKSPSKEVARIAQMKFYCSLSLKEYENFKGKKLNFFEKQLFKISQHRMRNMLKKYDSGDGPTTLQKMGWYLKGMLLGPIAIALAYIFLKDEERELIKWTWYGCIGFVVLILIVILSVL